MRTLIALLTALLIPLTSHGAGKDLKPYLRLMGGVNSFDAPGYNQYLAAQGFKKLTGTLGWGGEIGIPVLSALSLGARFGSRSNKVTEEIPDASVSSNPYFSSLQQNYLVGIARLNLINASFLHLSAFGGAGGSNTRIDVRTAAGEGTLGGLDKDGMGTLTMVGGSIGIGLFNTLLVVDAGREWNRPTGLKRVGVTGDAPGEVDLSGAFMQIGLLINGVPGVTRK